MRIPPVLETLAALLSAKGIDTIPREEDRLPVQIDTENIGEALAAMLFDTEGLGSALATVLTDSNALGDAVAYLMMQSAQDQKKIKALEQRVSELEKMGGETDE